MQSVPVNWDSVWQVSTESGAEWEYCGEWLQSLKSTSASRKWAVLWPKRLGWLPINSAETAERERRWSLLAMEGKDRCVPARLPQLWRILLININYQFFTWAWQLPWTHKQNSFNASSSGIDWFRAFVYSPGRPDNAHLSDTWEGWDTCWEPVVWPKKCINTFANEKITRALETSALAFLSFWNAQIVYLAQDILTLSPWTPAPNVLEPRGYNILGNSAELMLFSLVQREVFRTTFTRQCCPTGLSFLSRGHPSHDQLHIPRSGEACSAGDPYQALACIWSTSQDVFPNFLWHVFLFTLMEIEEHDF